MKAKTIKYEYLKNLGNYEHKKLSIELEVEEGEKAKDVLKKAIEFVEKELNVKNETDDLREKMEYRSKNPSLVTASVYLEAKEWLKNNPKAEEDDDIPPF